jgi:hypothetical protein
MGLLPHLGRGLCSEKQLVKLVLEDGTELLNGMESSYSFTSRRQCDLL